MDALGARVKARRREFELSQANLGELVGRMSQAWVSRVEKGTLTPNASQLRMLQDVLGPLGPRDDPSDTGQAEGTPRGPAAYKAARLANANQKRRAQLTLRLEQLESKERETMNVLAAERTRAAAFVEQFVTVAETLPNAGAALLALGTQSNFDISDGDDAQRVIDVRNSVLHQLGVQLGAAAAAGVGAGAVAGGAAAFGTYTAVGAFATASTGTVISTLSGVAASNAALAFLGGGSMAAGGLGVAGGTAVLTGMVAAPALIAAGFAVTVMGRKLLGRVEDERTQLLEAGIEVERLQAMVDELCSQAEMARELLIRARQFGQPQLKALRDRDGSGFDAPAFEKLAMVAALVLTILPLPIASEPDHSSPLGRAHRANEIALGSAEAWMLESGVLA